MAKLLWYNKYTDWIKKWLSEQDSIYEADRDVTKSVTNSHFDWKSMFILNNERWYNSVFTQFQTFISYQFANLYYWWWKLNRKYGKIMWYIYTYMVAWVLLWAYEEYLRRKTKEVLYWTKNDNSYYWDIIDNMIWYIPFLNHFYWVSKYDSVSTYKWFSDFINWIKEMIVAYKSENKNFTKTDMINFLWSIWTLFWIWWTGEAKRIAKSIYKYETSPTIWRNKDRRNLRTRRIKPKRILRTRKRR
jgi:hypothetical protein